KNAALLGKDPSKQELDYYYKQIGIAAMTAAGGSMPLTQFEEHFDRVIYFLNRLSHCVSGNICDAEIADDYFHEYAASFWNYFSGYIENQRKGGSANFAKPIEEFVQRGQAEEGTR
ncbi:MAG TPA: hypothetical protein VMF90_03420, partial [Rhizobiaceae bacterium]|nr:hypothetical protein [Rhizobiaceae bacterium]